MAEKRRYADRRDYLIKAVQIRRKRVRQMALEMAGGKCRSCGYQKCPEALEFHHRDGTEKDFSVSGRGYTRSWAKIRAEIGKCLLLCANCHREVHAGQRQVDTP